MSYDPDRHHRHSIRLRGYDYASPGVYFVTLCTHQRRCLFGTVTSGEMHLGPYGHVLERYWAGIPDHNPEVRLDACQVMPNHIHGLLEITGPDPDGATSLPNLDDAPDRPTGPQPGSLGAILGNLQSVTARRINRVRHTPGTPVWQRSFWDHIVRNEDELHRIRHYIITNPVRWDQDVLNQPM